MSDILDGLNKAVGKVQELGGKVVDSAKEALDKTDLDEKIVGAAKDLKDRTQAFLDKTDLDEKIVGAAKGLKDKAQGLLDKTELDEKVFDAAKGLKDKAVGLVSRPEADAPKTPDAVPDIMTRIGQDVDAQIQTIRAAASSTNSIHDYIQAKYNAQSDAPAPDVQAAAEKAVQAADEMNTALGENMQDIADRAAAIFAEASDAEAPKE